MSFAPLLVFFTNNDVGTPPRVWDRAGNAVSDAWDATKHGVKKAGKAVGNAAEKVGEKAKDAVD